MPSTSSAEGFFFSGLSTNTSPSARLIRTSPSSRARSSNTDKSSCVSRYVCISSPPRLPRPRLLLRKLGRRQESATDSLDSKRKQSCKRRKHKLCACQLFATLVSDQH